MLQIYKIVRNNINSQKPYNQYIKYSELLKQDNLDKYFLVTIEDDYVADSARKMVAFINDTLGWDA